MAEPKEGRCALGCCPDNPSPKHGTTWKLGGLTASLYKQVKHKLRRGCLLPLDLFPGTPKRLQMCPLDQALAWLPCITPFRIRIATGTQSFSDQALISPSSFPATSPCAFQQR